MFEDNPPVVVGQADPFSQEHGCGGKVPPAQNEVVAGHKIGIGEMVKQ
jgi:hypothetical protein